MLASRRTRGVISFLTLVTLPLLCGGDWLQFRGSRNTSVASGDTSPVAWSKDDVAWSRSLPGRCVSGPIVVAGRVVTTSSSGTGNERLHIWAVDCQTGNLEWRRQLWATGRTYCHPLSSMASPTPASDGQRLFVLFATNDLVCLDLDGNVQWMRALGREYPFAFDDRGLGSSPVVAAGTVVVQIECKGDSAVMGIDALDGRLLWRHELPRQANWCSPTVFAATDQELVLVQSLRELLVVEPRSGEVLDRYAAAGNSIPSVTVNGNMIFLPADGLTALRYEPGAALELVWREDRLGPQSSSPVIGDGKVFVMRAPSILVCGDIRSGEVLWRERLKGDRSWATPVLAGGLLYTVAADGLVQVVDVRGANGQVISEIDMDEEILGSPALVDGALYLRGVEHLWKIGPPN
jgi:outer membrane protein assembly factor BamB